jgi:predicted kinase
MGTTLKILVGNIASGKSTYSREQGKWGAVIIDRDALLMMLHGNDYTGYNHTLKPMYKDMENFLIRNALSYGRTVILDRTNMDKARRSRFIQFGKQAHAKVECYVFPMEPADVHARRRFESDARGYPLHRWQEVAARFASEYEQPTYDEGFDSIFNVDLVAGLQLVPNPGGTGGGV